jgi:hypothetical protein
MVALAVAALMDRGAPILAPMAARRGLVKTLIVGHDPLTPEDGAALRRIADEGDSPSSRCPERRQPTKSSSRARGKVAGRARPGSAEGRLDRRPPTDDRPFFST